MVKYKFVTTTTMNVHTVELTELNFQAQVFKRLIVGLTTLINFEKNNVIHVTDY
jgi:hypothetical protein